MSTRDLIDNIKKGDAQKSNNTFNSIMHDKIIDALDTHKQEVASKLYGASNDSPVAEEPAVETPQGEVATDENV
jgi:hypothetical protein|tara:strand:- start:18367 stop:18588 length:222 start_codon:yes stop_codon:yes gene_type:complete